MKHNFFVEVGYKTSPATPTITASCIVQVLNPESATLGRVIRKAVGSTFIDGIPPGKLCNGIIQIMQLSALGQFD